MTDADRTPTNPRKPRTGRNAAATSTPEERPQRTSGSTAAGAQRSGATTADATASCRAVSARLGRATLAAA